MISSLLVALTGCNEANVPVSAPSVTLSEAAEAAQKKCTEAANGPPPKPWVQKPVEKFDDCIAAEANKWPMETRNAICALGRSGGSELSTVEVYMSNGRCLTDYE